MEREKRNMFVIGGCYSYCCLGNCEIYDSLFIDCHSRVSLIQRNDQTAPGGSLMQKKKTAKTWTNLGLTCGQKDKIWTIIIKK